MSLKLKNDFIGILKGLSEDEIGDLLYLEKLAVDYFKSNHKDETLTSIHDLDWYFNAAETLYRGNLDF